MKTPSTLSRSNEGVPPSHTPCRAIPPATASIVPNASSVDGDRHALPSHVPHNAHERRARHGHQRTCVVLVAEDANVGGYAGSARRVQPTHDEEGTNRTDGAALGRTQRVHDTHLRPAHNVSSGTYKKGRGLGLCHDVDRTGTTHDDVHDVLDGPWGARHAKGRRRRSCSGGEVDADRQSADTTSSRFKRRNLRER